MTPSATDIEAIRQVLYRYCRGLDRMDRELVARCFAPQATVDYRSIFEGPASAFIDEVWDRHAVHLRHSHQIANVLVEDDGRGAVSEAYVTVTLWTTSDGGLVERVVRGRYLDRWSCEAGWQIEHRTFVADHRSEQPLPAEAIGPLLAHSTRDRSDPSYGFLDRAPARPDRIEDPDPVRAIHDLKARYLNALDLNRWDEVAALLTEDVEVRYASGGHHHVGRQAVIEFLRRTTVAAATTGSSHVAANPIIELHGPGRATGTWRLTDLVHDRQRSSLLVGAATYTDEYRRTDVGWQIASTGYERLLEVRLPS